MSGGAWLRTAARGRLVFAQRRNLPQRSGVLRRAGWMLAFVAMVALSCHGPLVAGEAPTPPQSPRILETDLSPQPLPRPSPPLEAYLATVQATLQQAVAPIAQAGLVEVKLTIRRDGSMAFVEVVPLEGPTTLRDQVLPLVSALGPWPPPPGETDMLLVGVLLSLEYPGSDLWDTIDQFPPQPEADHEP
jgi:hypothetical protein